MGGPIRTASGDQPRTRLRSVRFGKLDPVHPAPAAEISAAQPNGIATRGVSPPIVGDARTSASVEVRKPGEGGFPLPDSLRERASGLATDFVGDAEDTLRDVGRRVADGLGQRSGETPPAINQQTRDVPGRWNAEASGLTRSALPGTRPSGFANADGLPDRSPASAGPFLPRPSTDPVTSRTADGSGSIWGIGPTRRPSTEPSGRDGAAGQSGVDSLTDNRLGEMRWSNEDRGSTTSTLWTRDDPPTDRGISNSAAGRDGRYRRPGDAFAGTPGLNSTDAFPGPTRTRGAEANPTDTRTVGLGYPPRGDDGPLTTSRANGLRADESFGRIPGAADTRSVETATERSATFGRTENSAFEDERRTRWASNGQSPTDRRAGSESTFATATAIDSMNPQMLGDRDSTRTRSADKSRERPDYELTKIERLAGGEYRLGNRLYDADHRVVSQLQIERAEARWFRGSADADGSPYRGRQDLRSPSDADRFSFDEPRRSDRPTDRRFDRSDRERQFRDDRSESSRTSYAGVNDDAADLRRVGSASVASRERPSMRERPARLSPERPSRSLTTGAEDRQSPRAQIVHNTAPLVNGLLLVSVFANAYVIWHALRLRSSYRGLVASKRSAEPAVA